MYISATFASLLPSERKDAAENREGTMLHPSLFVFKQYYSSSKNNRLRLAGSDLRLQPLFTQR